MCRSITWCWYRWTLSQDQQAIAELPVNSIPKYCNLTSDLREYKSLIRCMPNTTRRNKEQTLLFSDPACLERSICKEKRTASIDNNIRTSTDTRLPPSTETTLPSTAHTHPTHFTSNIDPRDMVATIVLIHDATGNLHDQEGHLRNAACQKIDDHEDVIHDTDVDITASQAVEEASRPKTLADYNMPDQFYENILWEQKFALSIFVKIRKVTKL
ncbi:hypothetical protein IGI04_019118 [Brassica rapa subsp. trilocularis]|uniref:Uncharacterized protein n=1 Tax=Brassica rapa subsp. trilocularis TaxID=1813537 RepID=A0ABQ7MI98_BRACM|nr:hypothetical protein IGI04_019118 [Brassica rapa subsp. trilocularis]